MNCKRCCDSGYSEPDKPCDGRGCESSREVRGLLTHDHIKAIRELAVIARDTPATWDDRDCPLITLWNHLSPDDVVRLCDSTRPDSL